MSCPGLVHLLLLHLEGTQVNWQGETQLCTFTVMCVHVMMKEYVHEYVCACYFAVTASFYYLEQV